VPATVEVDAPPAVLVLSDEVHGTAALIITRQREKRIEAPILNDPRPEHVLLRAAHRIGEWQGSDDPRAAADAARSWASAQALATADPVHCIRTSLPCLIAAANLSRL
jgi:hypothetical protein